MPDAARPAADLLCPGLAARRLAGGLRQFLSLDRRLPTCQLSPGSDMPSHTLGSVMGQSAPPSFRGRHGRTCFDTRRGGPAASPRQAVAAIGGRPHHLGDGCSPVTGRQGGRPWRVLWAMSGRRGLYEKSENWNSFSVAWEAPMKLPRCRFLHLAGVAAAVAVLSVTLSSYAAWS